MSVTPHTLIDMWKEESEKAKELELRFKAIMKERGVSSAGRYYAE